MPHDHDHDHEFDGASPAYRRALIAVIVLNAGLFGVEMTAGAMAGSRALQADALDFAADALTYGISLWAIGRPLALRARVAQLKGLSLALMALAILGLAIRDMMAPGVPEAGVMGAVGFAALAANVASVLILMRWKDGDSNVRSVWLCSRNDAIGNVAVMGAAVMVAWLGSGWPDLVVAVAMAGLFLSSSVQILRRAAQERAHAH
ncbi:cation transporter [Pararhodobacter aggregans]|uniref:Cation transporter n=1 Tax=Pararhodobacter aggregans TaxID=404875 RepID=A0A2T7UVM1_9RHOB|nr:cation transporter [Pararhodobacter aggregans]PTX03904.1 Co/Zn/Cd efflux system component [Pararhodobacter aggregans]PVE48619.1 cation transporter [Pararhodobacter aggregans]